MARKKLCKRAKRRKRVRVGTKYQANIPTGVKEDGRSDLFRFGRPIPVTWVCRRDMQTVNENPIESNSSSDPETREVNMSSEVGGEDEINLECNDEGLLPVPDPFCESWSSLEHDTFLLSLYIFGENFGLAKEFMGNISNKRMGSLASYHYELLHNYQDYERWSKWTADRKMTLNAKKIFTGLEHHELLTRLVANVTQERRDSLVMLGDNYLGERLSLKEFVFNLRDIVGMNQLVEAVAIGQEDRDLFEFPPTSNYYVIVQELPTANTFTSVTNQTIIDILNGDARLSKEKTRQIFCDLVWPRLVSKGWCRCQNSKHLVFFVPGVVDFSSDELEKGIHYFDSMIDVLSTLASKPHLLESESDIEIDPVTNQDLDNEKQHDYIQTTDCPQSNHDLHMKELTSSLVSEPADETEQGPEEPLNLDTNQYLENEEQNGYIEPNVENDQDLKGLTILDTGLDCDVDESITSQLYDGIQEQTPSGNGKYDDIIEEHCLKMVAESDSGESSFTQELKTNQPDFSKAGAKMVHQRFSMRDRTATPKVLEAFAYGYLGPKRKRKGGEKMPSRQVRGKIVPVASGCAGGAEKVVEDTSQ